MKSVIAHSITSVRTVNTRYGEKVVSEIEIKGLPQQEFWMSLKQGNKLNGCFDALQRHGGYSSKHGECHIIIDDSGDKDRFVWCGMHTGKHSDLPFLEEKFGVICESPYIGRQDSVNDEADESLKDVEESIYKSAQSIDDLKSMHHTRYAAAVSDGVSDDMLNNLMAEYEIRKDQILFDKD